MPSHRANQTAKVTIVEGLRGGVPGVGLQVRSGGHCGGSGCSAVTRSIRMNMTDGVGPDEGHCIRESEAHLGDEHLVDGAATQLRVRQTCSWYATSDGVLPAVLEADGNRPVGGEVDGQPAQQSPEVGSADGVAVLLEDGLEERVHQSGGGGAEGNQTRIRYSGIKIS